MAFKNRVRLPVLFFQPQFPIERNVFRLANGATKVQSVVIRNTFDGKTDQLPEVWHRKLVIALSHDTVTIENERLLSDVVLTGDYGIDWPEFLQYPLAQANFNVDVTPFSATNSNCKTCEEMAQISLVDDTTDEIWEEGTTHDFPDVITDNDTICCRPYTIDLVTYNTEFFTGVSISADGVLTATVINPCPVVNNVFIATYRVTCADGQYDEANVYGNISGTDTNFCAPPTGFAKTELSSTSVKIDWADGSPVPAFWNWVLYYTSDLGAPIQSGSGLLVSEVTLTGLVSFTNYTIFVTANCGDTNFSTPARFDFSITSYPSNNCGNFNIITFAFVINISYMGCDGEFYMETLVGPSNIERCMLVTAGTTTPVYFVASRPDVDVIYLDLC